MSWRFCASIIFAFLGVTATAQTPQSITVSSPVLKSGQPIPQDYTADGKNVSPPITWTNAPAGTKEFAVIMDDPDVPMPQPFVHWVIYKIPATANGLPENIPIDAATPMPAAIAGAVQGVSGFRRPIYRGPAPPPGKVAPLSLHGLRARRDSRSAARTEQAAAARRDEGPRRRSGRAGRDLRAEATITSRRLQDRDVRQVG